MNNHYPIQHVNNNDKSLTALKHASSLIAMVLSVGWLYFVEPLIIWFIYH